MIDMETEQDCIVIDSCYDNDISVLSNNTYYY